MAPAHPWFRPATPCSSSSFLPPFVSLIRTTRPSCSWPSWRAGTTVRTPSGSSITWGPRSWWVGRLSPWPRLGAAAELRGCQGGVSASWSSLHDASNQKHRERSIRATGRGREVTPVWRRGPLPSASPQGEPPQAALLGEGSTGGAGLEFIHSSALPWGTLVPLWAPLPWKEEDGVSWSRGLLGSLSRWSPQGPVCNARP